MNFDLIEDVSVLTDVSHNIIDKFVSVADYSICHDVYETLCCKEDTSVIDIGIGELHVKVDFNGLRYRFIPSNELEKLLVKTVTSRCSPMILKVDKNLQEKIERTYKELL